MNDPCPLVTFYKIDLFMLERGRDREREQGVGQTKREKERSRIPAERKACRGARFHDPESMT